MGVDRKGTVIAVAEAVGAREKWEIVFENVRVSEYKIISILFRRKDHIFYVLVADVSFMKFDPKLLFRLAF